MLIKELKYKNFKGIIDAAAPLNLIKKKFIKDVIKQSLRPHLARIWNHDHLKIYKTLI